MFAKKVSLEDASSLFVGVIAVSQILAVLTWWVAGSYFSINIFTSISFFAFDHHCLPSDALGVHCFGDSLYPITMAMSDNPWSGDHGINPYLGLGMVPYWFYGHLIQIVGDTSVVMFVNLMLLITSLSVPFVWVSRGRKFEFWPLLILCIGPLTVPGIVALDRGNSVALIVGPLLWFTVSFIKNNLGQVVLSVTILAAIKPQYGLLVILLAAYREWKPFFSSIRALAVTQFLGFLLWPNSFPGSVLQAFSMSQKFQSYSSVSDNFPPQISLASGIFQIERIVRGTLNIQTPYSNFFSMQLQTKIGFLFAIPFALCLFFKGRHSPRYLTASILIAILSMISATTYSYYGVFAIVLAAILIQNSSLVSSPDSQDKSLLSRIQAVSLVLALSLTLTRFPLVATFWIGDIKLVETSAFFTPLAWMLVTLIWMIESCIKSNGVTNSELKIATSRVQ